MSIANLVRSAVTAIVTLSAPVMASAQVFGTFPWQMQPYCNVVTMTLTNSPAGWSLVGVDDQCGAPQKASAYGVASFGATGAVTLSFTIVTAPAARPVHVSAEISPATGSGTWKDSAGNTGVLAFFGQTPGLPVRPLPASGLGVSVITSAELAPGSVRAADIDTAEVQARVTGTCTGGGAVVGVNANGTVNCSAFPDVIPSGATVTGNIVWTGSVPTTGNTAFHQMGVNLPARASVVSSVGFNSGFLDGLDPSCTGSLAAPTAPPGKVCIYPFSYSGTLNTAVGGTFAAPGLPLDGRSFTLFFRPDAGLAAGTGMAFNGVWAYTAP
jgi:hypothetical protein